MQSLNQTLRKYTFIEFIRKKATSCLEDQNDFEELYTRFVAQNPLKDMVPFGFYLVNYNTCEFSKGSSIKTVSGYSDEEFIKNGLEGSVNRLHPDDKELFSSEVFPDILSFLSTISPSDYIHYKITYNYRYFNAEGHYIHLLQQSAIVKSNVYGEPLLNFGFVTDISHLKTDNKMILNIFTNHKGSVFKKEYLKTPDVFSKRELDVLMLSMYGLRNKEIANKLFISLHTVKNHKRNMMGKADVKNIGGLINFATKNRIILSVLLFILFF